MTFDPAWEAEHKRRRWGMIANHHLARFVTRTFPDPKGLRVLDIGAGAGAQSQYLVNIGWGVVALDGSNAAIERIAADIWEGDARVALHTGDVAVVQYPEAHFDCIVDVASLQCLPLDQADDVVQRARQWLKPNGCFFSYTDAGSDKSLHTIGTVYPRTHAQVRKMFRGYSFAIGNEVVDRPDGPSTRHLIIEARVQS